MRVLRLCSVFEPPASALEGRGAAFDPIGGMQEHTGSLTRTLDRRGVTQVVLTTRPPTAPWLERPSPRTTIVRVALPVRRPRQGYALPAAALAPLLGRRADIVHVHLGEDLAILGLAALAARPRRLPVVMTVHCSLAYTLKVFDIKTALLRTLGGAMERHAVRHVAATLVYTERLADRMAGQLGAGSVQVMRRGVDRALFAAPGEPPFARTADPTVLFVGRVAHQKGVETLVDAAARLRTPRARVVLVGDGPDRAKVERLVRRLGVEDRVHVTGFVPHDRIPAALAAADVVVLPSVYEELGTVLIEALHAGVPVVASRVGGIPDVVEHGVTGLLVAPGDAARLAAALDVVLGDPALAERLGANAARRAPEYDLEHVGAKIQALYERLAGAPLRPAPPVVELVPAQPVASASPSAAASVSR
jgi:glycosyltransferase involved in cell wall biosynthesis